MRILKLGLIVIVTAVVVFAGLSGGRQTLLAHEGEAQTFMVQAGALGRANNEALAFAPSIVQVHQGDTVMWHINGFHNIHFEDQISEFVIFPLVDGQPLPQINPAVAFPTINDGGNYTGDTVNSGLPETADIGTFSLVMDAPIGRYMYLCDIHPGMVGVIEVVADDVTIPSPAQVSAQGKEELSGHLGAGYSALPGLAADAVVKSENGVLNITVGSGGTGRATVNLFNSPVGIIQAGETVTWTNPADSLDPHFINSTPYDPLALPEIVPVEQPNGPPILTLGSGFLGTTPDGASIKVGDTFNSTFVLPGQSFSLTFEEPGMYDYECHIHPGMRGVIVVEVPAA